MSLYLIVSGAFLTTGGQDRANYALASYLARQGHEVHLVAHEVSPELLQQGQVICHRAAKPLGATLLGEPRLDRVGRKVARELRSRGARVIVNGGNCRWDDVNWVHYVHSAYRRCTQGPLRRMRYALAHRRFVLGEQRALAMARLVIANSQHTALELETRLGIDRERIRVIYYGIDSNVFRPADDAQRLVLRRKFGWTAPAVLFIGAMGDHRKGFDVAYRAWKLLCARADWDAQLHVVGRGMQVRMWKSRVHNDGLEQRVRFLGFRSDVPDLLRAADALISPTRYEPYGLGVHEAICCGLPALVSGEAGVAERYPPELRELMLPDPENAEDLAERLRQWRAGPARFAEALARFGEELRNRSWDDMASEIVRAMQMQWTIELLRRGSRAPRDAANQLEPSL